MAVPNLPGENPLGPRHVRILKISIAVMTVLLVAGLVALIYGMARQASRVASKSHGAPAAAPYSTTLKLVGGEVKGLTASGDRIILHWKGETGDILVVLDATNGNELGRIQVGSR